MSRSPYFGAAIDNTSPPTFGQQLRDWRRRRGLAQLDLAVQSNVSARHLSFLETGRANPSREMVLRLGEQLDVPLRERNTWLAAAGFTPEFTEAPLDAPSLTTIRSTMLQILKGHEPNPALVIDRHWNMIAANASVAPLIGDFSPELFPPPVNVLRLTLHPRGLAPRIRNLRVWSSHVLARLARQMQFDRDPRHRTLFGELQGYCRQHHGIAPLPARGPAPLVVPLELAYGDDTLSLISTTTVFATPSEITTSELAIESFFPADEATAERLRALPRK